jgi:O-antigen ligase
MQQTAAPGSRPALLDIVASNLFALTLFLLSADLLFLKVEGNKIKLGYLLVLSLWLLRPGEMLAAARGAIAKVPKWIFLAVVPLAVSVATSANPRNSVLWALWGVFDLFTIVTVYAFLKAHRFTAQRIQESVTVSLGLITFWGLIQFLFIYGFGRVIFEPQFHFDVYRINGLSGWPVFLNIFAFLLVPLVIMMDKRWSWPVRLVLIALVFVLVQSTAKTGWVLFVALGALMFVLARRLFARRYLAFLVPVTVVALLIPTPSFDADDAPITGTEKVAKFAADLDLSNQMTSGTDRVLINELGLKVWQRHPWFGVGPRAYSTYMYGRFDRELPGVSKYDANRQVIAKNENIWVELLAENGVLFTLSFLAIVVWALWVPGWRFANGLHVGTWMALVMYFSLSGQVSQTGLLTMAYAVFGIYFFAREGAAKASQTVASDRFISLDTPSVLRLKHR